MGKVKSCLRFEGVTMLGSGNLGAVTWSEMTDSKATVCARFTTPPLGTSGVCIVVTVKTKSS